jgi:hypothetical protein
VRIPPAAVTAKLAAGRAGVVRDALGRDVPAARDWMFVLRIERHPWTLVIPGTFVDVGRIVGDLDELSRDAGTTVFHFSHSDTAGSMEYRLVEKGTESECFKAENDRSESFRSLRGTKPPKPEDFHRFVSEVVIALDIYLPSISGEYFVGYERSARGPWLVRNPGQVLWMGPEREITSVPPFESVDYIWDNAKPKI